MPLRDQTARRDPPSRATAPGEADEPAARRPASDVLTPFRPAPEAPSEAFRGPRYLAGVDGISGAVLKGWAVDLSTPRAAVGLTLIARGQPIFSFLTTEHRPDIASVLEGNVAGFALDLATLTNEARAAVADALATQDAFAPPRLVALRLETDGSLIDLGGFGLRVGDILAAIGAGPPMPPPAAPAPGGRARRRAERTPTPRDVIAVRWLTAHLARDLSADAAPARQFAARLLADIEASALVSPAVKQHAAAIAPVFDPFHYLDGLAAPDEAIANPLLHYVLAGWREGASPSPLFAPDYYKRGRGTMAGDPLLDFMRGGGADPHPLFDVAYYRETHLGGDADVNPLVHYLNEGGRQRLDPSPHFDTARFLEAFGLADEIDVPLEAFVTIRAYHDFALTPAFDAPLYRYQIEIERGERLDEPPYVHYLARGYLDETLLPNLLFDPLHYRAANKLTFQGPALTHYLTEGEARGLACHPVFSPEYYDKQRGEQGGALAHALANPGAFRSLARMEHPVDPRLFAFVRDLIAEDGVDDFNLSIYRDANPDLAAFDDAALEAHYRTRGAVEQRIASLTRAMRLAEMRVRDLPLGFVLDDYVDSSPDLGAFKGRLVSALYHYGRYGRHEKRMIGKWLFKFADLDIDLPSADAPLHVAPQAERVEACILIHAFYPELLPELVAFAQNFREVSFDIFINVVDSVWTPALQEQLRAICPGAFVMLSNDAGRDIGGFTRLLEHIDIARYDVFALLHSKKSPHIAAETGEYWRRSLLNAIAGSPETGRDNVRMFHDNPRLGLIGCKEWRSTEMGKNVEQYERLLDLLGVRGKNRELDYLSGFMFLIRADVVARLFEVLRKLDFEYGGDKDLDFHIDGQVAHGVERAVPALVRQMGYELLFR